MKAPLFNEKFYKEHGYRLPDNWQEMKMTGLTMKKKRKGISRW
jgi:hypothetical protein